MIDYAWDMGLSGMAFTDHDCLSGTLKELDEYRAKLTKEWKKLHEDAEELPSFEE